MTKTKKIVIAVLIPVLAAAIAVLCIFLPPALSDKGDISGAAQTAADYYDRQLPRLYTDEQGDFTILQLSDTHFTTGKTDSDELILRHIRSVVAEKQPELVVVAGDMIDDGDKGYFNKKQVLDIVAGLFEESQQYWAYIPGNNDGMNYGTSADVCAYLSAYPHCLVANETGVSGGAQYTVEIYRGDKPVHALLFMDTNDYNNSDPLHIYGYLQDNQIAWADRTLAALKKAHPELKTSIFLHENTPAFADAAQEFTQIAGYLPVSETKEIFAIPQNAALDEVIAANGTTGLVSMGHKHPEANECSLYNGIYYHVSTTAKTGFSLITLHTGEQDTEKRYSFEAIYFTQE